MSRVFFRMLLGFAAGLIAWALIEPTAPAELSPQWGAFEIHMMMSLGAIVGLVLGLYNGWTIGSRTRMMTGAVGGLILGMVGSLMGYGVGSALERVIFGQSIEALQLQNQIVTAYMARIVALTPIGVLLGVVIGAVTLDWRRVIHGAIGGLIGGAIGSMIFDPIALLVAGPIIAAKGLNGMQEVGVASRAAFFIVMSGSIALFIGIVEQMARQASLRLALGRNEGRDYPLFGTRSVIGRNELAQVPIYHDPAVAPMHAYVDRVGPSYWLRDAGSGAPTFLNGVPVAAAPLDHGAQIQVGNTVLQFLLKALPKPTSAVAAAPAYTMAPMGGVYAAVQGNPAPTAMAAPIGYQPAPASVPVSQPTTVVAAQPMAPTLIAVDGPLAGQRFPVAGPLEIGRESPGVTLRFDSSASRRHASMNPAPGGVMLQDLGSTNGTFVNGQRVTSATIRPGDLVKIGATTFRIE